MDRTDYQILNLLQDDSRCTLRRMGDLVGLTPPAVSERIRRMEESGVIRGYHIDIDRTNSTATLRASSPLPSSRTSTTNSVISAPRRAPSSATTMWWASSTPCCALPCAIRSSSTSFCPSSRSLATRAPRSSLKRFLTARISLCRNGIFPLIKPANRPALFFCISQAVSSFLPYSAHLLVAKEGENCYTSINRTMLFLSAMDERRRCACSSSKSRP